MFLNLRQVKAPISLDVAIPGREETWHFRIWTTQLFAAYAGAAAPEIDERFFLEYHGATGSPEAEGLWCEDLFRAWLDPESTTQFKLTRGRPPEWLRSNNLGVLNMGGAMAKYFREVFRTLRAQNRPLPCVFAPNPVYRAATFGALGFRLSRDGAHRGHEMLQLQYEEPFLKHVEINGQQWRFMEVMPKGQKGTQSRPAQPAFKLVSDAADRALEAHLNFQKMLGDPYIAVMKQGGPAQSGAFVFQTNGIVISTHTLNTCLRLLAYSAFRDLRRVPNLTTHTLRHAFAKRARKAGASTNQVALILNHVDLDTTHRYSRPTRSDQMDALVQIAIDTGMWSPTNYRVEQPTILNPMIPIFGLSGLTEDEFDAWLRETELEFEKQEWALFDQMHGIKA